MTWVGRRNLGPPIIFLPSRRRPSGQRPDVLLLQGFGTGGRAMEWIARSLERRGLTCAVPRSGGLLGYLQTTRVDRAGSRVARLLRRLPGSGRTWIIGHSIGGIIARYAVQAEAASDVIAGVVTLGSPHSGTHSATLGLAGVWFLSRAPADVRPGSRVLGTLNQLPWPDRVPLVAIHSHGDLLCAPHAAAVPFDGPAVKTLHFGSLGHTELLWNRDVRSAIVSHIAGPAPFRETRPGENP